MTNQSCRRRRTTITIRTTSGAEAGDSPGGVDLKPVATIGTINAAEAEGLITLAGDTEVEVNIADAG